MIKLDNLSFGYKKNEILFKTINCDFQLGNVCGLLGKNGSGKTTLLKIMTGLLFPKKGDCHLFGFDARKRQPNCLENIYFVTEDFFVPQLTAKAYLNLYAPFYQHFDRKLFERSLNEFDVVTDKLLTKLSYGQKKKFLISFSLATNCKLTIFDEPTNGLDIPSKKQFRKLITENMSDDKLFIISTHQVHDVEKLVDRVVILDEGNILINVSMEQVAKRLKVEQQTSEPSLTACLYYEKHLDGYVVVVPNQSGIETSIDLELLFNAVISNKDLMRKLLKEENS